MADLYGGSNLPRISGSTESKNARQSSPKIVVERVTKAAGILDS
jgi:hypothetical protein